MSLDPSKATRGFISDQGPDGERITETFTCCHCNVIVALDPREPPAICMPCFKRVCEKCHADGRCMPFERKLERFEKRVNEQVSRGVFLRSIGLE